jgi:hypothetical protein
MADNLELLRQIQDGAVSAAVPVSELLRRCQVLAARLNLSEMGEWVRYELNGYPTEVDLPDYRIFSGIAKGHFLGPFGSGLRNAVLPANNLPKEFRDWARKAYFRQPIAALQEVADEKGRGDVYCAWPGDLIAQVQHRFYENMVLGQAWRSVSRSDFVSAVETVRNRILTFALEAETYVKPEEESAHTTGVGQALSQVFHTIVYGSVGNFAQASTNITQHAGIAAGDLQALISELQKLGVPPEDIRELENAVVKDGPSNDGKVGERVAGWAGEMIGKAMSGTWAVATTTAAAVLPKLIERYYNLSA